MVHTTLFELHSQVALLKDSIIYYQWEPGLQGYHLLWLSVPTEFTQLPTGELPIQTLQFQTSIERDRIQDGLFPGHSQLPRES